MMKITSMRTINQKKKHHFNNNQYEITVHQGIGYETKTLEFYTDESKSKMSHSIYYIDEGDGPLYYFHRLVNGGGFVMQHACKKVHDNILLKENSK